MEQARKYNLTQWVIFVNDDDMQGQEQEEKKVNAFIADILPVVETVSCNGLDMDGIKKVQASMCVDAGVDYEPVCLELAFYNASGWQCARCTHELRGDESLSIEFNTGNIAIIKVE